MTDERKAPTEQQQPELSTKRNRVERTRRAQERAKFEIEGKVGITNKFDEKQTQKILDTIKLLKAYRTWR
jgi:hypothetical protein